MVELLSLQVVLFFLMPISSMINPIVLKKAKIAYNFGLFECNRVKR